MSPGASLGLSEPKSPARPTTPMPSPRASPSRSPLKSAKRPMSPGATLGLSIPNSAARPARPLASLRASPSRSPPKVRETPHVPRRQPGAVHTKLRRPSRKTPGVPACLSQPLTANPSAAASLHAHRFTRIIALWGC
jgi:hypothetical protein